MQLKTLTLKNIRSYGEERIPIPFTPGICLFEGDIGSGKSTILSAIEFGLFGLGDLDSKHLLRHGAKCGEVSLTFESQGHNYTVSRSLNRLKKSGKITHTCKLEYENSEPKEYSPSEIKIKVLDILGFNEKPDPKSASRIYRYAVYTPQEAMKEILNMKEKDRLEILRRAFGIEQYQWVIDNVKTILTNNDGINFKIKILEKELENLPEIADNLKSARKEKTDLKGKIQEKENQKRDLMTIIKAIDREKEELTPKRDALLTLSGKIPGLEGLLENLNDQLKQLKTTEKSLNDEFKELAAIEKNLLEISPLYEEYQTKKKRLEKLEGTVQKKDEINRNIRLLEEKIEHEKSLIKQNLQNLRDQYSAKTKIEADIQSLNLEKETLKVEKEHESHIISELNNLREEKERLGPKNDKLTRLQGEIPLLQDQQKQQEKRIKEIRNAAKNFKEQLDEIRKKEKEVQELLPLYSKYCQKKNDVESLEPTKLEFDKFEKERVKYRDLIDNVKQNLESTINELKMDKEDLQSTLQKILSLEEKQKELNAARSKIAAEIQQLNEIGEFIQNLDKKKTKLETKKENLDKKISELNKEWHGIDSIKVGAQCPRCKQVLTKEHIKKIGIEYQQEINGNEEEKIHLQDEIDKIAQQQEEYNQQIISLQDPQERLNRNDSRLVEIRSDLKNAAKERKRLEKNVKKLNDAQNSLNANSFALPERECLAQIKNDIQKLTPDVERYTELKTSIKKLDENKIPSRYNTLTGEIAQKDSLLGHIAENEEQRQSVEKASKQLKNDLEEKNQTLIDGKAVFDRIAEIKQEQDKAESELENIKEKVERFEKIPVEIKGYEKQLVDLEKMRPQIETFEKTLTENQFALTERTELKRIDEQLLKLQPDIEQYNILKIRIDELDEAEIVRKYTEYTTRIQGKDDHILKTKENNNQQTVMNAQIKEKEDEITKKKLQLEEGKTVIDKLTELEKQLKVENGKLVQIGEDLARLNTEKDSLNTCLESIQDEIKKFQKTTEKKKELEEIKRWLSDHFLPTVENIEKHVLAAINKQFNDLFQKSFSMLVESDDMNVMVTETFAPIIEQEGYEIDVNSLSGGEKTSVALAYRLALNTLVKQQIPSLKNSLLILDEPTDGFSSGQLHKLRDILKDTACDQIIMVSHENELEGFVDRIYHVTKDNGLSSVRG